ncbi:MAG: DotI/IcmL family type IV secretion protein [Pseudomonadota bacterium]
MKKILVVALLASGLFAPSLASAQPHKAPARPSWLEYKSPYVGEENDIANPHRTTGEIASWAQQAAADSLSFSRADYKIKLNGFKKYFVPEGWKFYAAYLKNTRLINMVVDDGYTVGTIVNDLPEIVNQGVSNGVYHWIVRMPITISFFSAGPQGVSRPGASGKYLLLLDVGRVAEGGIAIMSWAVEDMPVKQ